MGTPQFILASASPARRWLLQSVGIEPLVKPSDFDESQVQSADPEALVKALALSKATTIATQLNATKQDDRTASETLVLGCDSVLAINGEIHGKPASPSEAIARWQQMRGQVGKLYTGHALLAIAPASDDWGSEVRLRRERSAERSLEPESSVDSEIKTLVRCQITQVHFAQVSDRQSAAYVATGEPIHCAGGFALEGKGGLFVERLDGCHTNVIGLSLPLLRQMLDELGYDVTDFWSTDQS